MQVEMNNLHYYPYTSFTNEQLPILKAVVIYFDMLNILDPFLASWRISKPPQLKIVQLSDVFKGSNGQGQTMSDMHYSEE